MLENLNNNIKHYSNRIAIVFSKSLTILTIFIFNKNSIISSNQEAKLYLSMLVYIWWIKINNCKNQQKQFNKLKIKIIINKIMTWEFYYGYHKII
jgi:hypothetical protein